MSETKWTKWRWHVSSDHPTAANVVVVADETHAQVARVIGDEIEEARDAAALIAAAPDLYASLKEIVERRARACREAGGSASGSDGRYTRARAALAKARGETP